YFPGAGRPAAVRRSGRLRARHGRRIRHQRPVSRARNASGSRARGSSPASARSSGSGSAARAGAGRGRARRQALGQQSGCVLARVSPRLARGGHPHVPRRSAAAHSGCGDGGSAHRGQDSLRRLGRPPRRFDFAARERLDVGPHAHRPHRRCGSRGARLDALVVRAATSRISEPVARSALRQAMRILGHQFVMGRTIDEALERADGSRERAYRYSFDMLGESALTARDAEKYFEKYRAAIIAVGRHAPQDQDITARHSISVKLSALHPRYELAQRDRVVKELGARLQALVKLARDCGVGLTVDAEEAERLELSLLLIDAVLASDVLAGYAGFGLAVQAYQRRAYRVLEWLASRARSLNRRITVRLVKGAYWDSEIKRAQERGLPSYPVFTRKPSTDVSYLACARLLSGMRGVIYPQFATHNAQTAAYVAEVFGNAAESFEYQRLHGMGEELYSQVIGEEQGGHACRVYAPVGPHEDLLPYLVRRLLENGANTSFVNRIVDARLPAEAVVTDPIAQVDEFSEIPHPRIVEPPRLYGPDR